MTTKSDLPTPLYMAQTAAANVALFAQLQEDDPLMSHINKLGVRGQQAAQLAGAMALVSIAEDLHAIAAKYTATVTIRDPADLRNQEAP